VVLHDVVAEDGSVAVDAPQRCGGLHAVRDVFIGEVARSAVADDVVFDQRVVAAVHDDLVAGNPLEDVAPEDESRVGLALGAVAGGQIARQTVPLAVDDAAVLDHQVVERRGVRASDDVVVEDARTAAFVVVGFRAVDVGDFAPADVDVVHHAALDVVSLDPDAGDLGPGFIPLVGDFQILQHPVLHVADQNGLVASAACDFGQRQAFVAVGPEDDRRFGRSAAAERERAVVDRTPFDEDRVTGLPGLFHDAVHALPGLFRGVPRIVVGSVFGVDVIAVRVGDAALVVFVFPGLLFLAGGQLADAQQRRDYDGVHFHFFRI